MYCTLKFRILHFIEMLGKLNYFLETHSLDVKLRNNITL